MKPAVLSSLLYGAQELLLELKVPAVQDIMRSPVFLEVRCFRQACLYVFCSVAAVAESEADVNSLLPAFLILIPD